MCVSGPLQPSPIIPARLCALLLLPLATSPSLFLPAARSPFPPFRCRSRWDFPLSSHLIINNSPARSQSPVDHLEHIQPLILFSKIPHILSHTKLSHIHSSLDSSRKTRKQIKETKQEPTLHRLFNTNTYTTLLTMSNNLKPDAAGDAAKRNRGSTTIVSFRKSPIISGAIGQVHSCQCRHNKLLETHQRDHSSRITN